MSLSEFIVIAILIAVGIIAGTWVFYAYWRVRSEIKRRVEGEPQLASRREVIWRDPGPVTALDLAAGPGGADGPPAPPFQFLEEHTGGSQPCVSIQDARHRRWRVKWGPEVNTETFATRLAWALGYFAEITYFVADGRMNGATTLTKAKACIDEQGRFEPARFELDEEGVTKHFDAQSWAWHDNPFVGTHELNGLKILVMLLSNWDNKDVRDAARGSNTAIFEARDPRGRLEARYLIIDWGAALGKWGSNILVRGRWNAQDYASQTAQLVTGVRDDLVQWGYAGQRTADAVDHISMADVRWFNQRVEALGDAQIADALRASGATPEEVEAFTSAIRARLDRLRDLTRRYARD